MSLPGICEKVAFLSQPAAYGRTACHVDIRETHISWIFLTETHAWKLKKPVCYEYLDFSTLEARRKDCEEELRLNRRLARDVYLDIVPLTLDAAGRLALGDRGRPVDWLVHMRRLPSALMLDRAIALQTWTEEDIRRLGNRLAFFYTEQAARIPLAGAQYRIRLSEDLIDAGIELFHEGCGLPVGLINAAVGIARGQLEQDAALFERRAHSGRIVEGHGDLRPEHICLEPEPVIIDCLEFSAMMRQVDPVSELAFLALECERLGAPRAGEVVIETYCAATGDRPVPAVLDFYRRYHACVRAKIAVWHLRDSAPPSFSKWTNRALQYLRYAAALRAA
ncbi:MAG TPA: hypothetical protein VFY29_08735 [Terriglobia bacterium]|nr:hypothetical protein [Terriglobia bacterium]